MTKNHGMKPLFICDMVMIVTLLIGIICSVFVYSRHQEYAFYNNTRILLADEIQKIEACYTISDTITFDEAIFEEERNKAIDYQLVVTDSSGRIIYSDYPPYKKGSTLSTNQLVQNEQSEYQQGGNKVKMSFVLEKDNGEVGFLGFWLDRALAFGKTEFELGMEVFFPIGLAILLSIGILLFKTYYIRKHILEPVWDMTISTKAIIDGNYEATITRPRNEDIEQDDINKLAYHFDLMRDELQERERRENELKNSQKEMISCISHDLKTPISTIQAYGEGIRDGLSADPKKVHKYAEIIVSKSQQLTKMIKDLLDHSNAELNQLSIIKKEQYFNDFINQAALELTGLVEHNDIQFSYENTAPNLLLEFDESRINQVLSNLVDNAIKYRSQSQPVISLRVSYDGNENALLVTVSDNGRGIELADIPFVFDRFYRGEKSRSTSIPGSGLGLSICKYIVEAHLGELTCESHSDSGTVFLMKLFV